MVKLRSWLLESGTGGVVEIVGDFGIAKSESPSFVLKSEAMRQAVVGDTPSALAGTACGRSVACLSAVSMSTDSSSGSGGSAASGGGCRGGGCERLPKLALRGELVGVGVPRRSAPAALPSECSEVPVDVEARSWSSTLVAAARARTCAASLVAEPPLAMALARNASDRRLSLALIVDRSDSVDALACMAADVGGAVGLEEKPLA